MSDIEAIKSRNRLEDVVEETGWALDRQPGQRYWRGASDPDLTVDLERQAYYWGSEKGDVIAWLRARFDWEFGEALRYLRHRADLPADLRPRFPARDPAETPTLAGAVLQVEKQAEPVAIAEPGQAWGIDDSRVRRALVLGWDYPGGIEHLVKTDRLALAREIGTLARLFTPLAGSLALIAEFCDQCEGPLGKDAYLTVALGPDRPVINAGLVYCANCYAAHQRWTRALELIETYQRTAPAENGAQEKTDGWANERS